MGYAFRCFVNTIIQNRHVSGSILACDIGLSFWGGVHPETGTIVDTHHPQQNESVAGKIVMMPSSRGSCTGSAVLLGLALAGNAPSAIVFAEDEDVLTLGAVIANTMYGAEIAIARLDKSSYTQLSLQATARFTDGKLIAGSLEFHLQSLDYQQLVLSDSDKKMADGRQGPALQIAMQTICTLGLVQGAEQLIDVSRAHIDGCIYASPANLIFAQTVMKMGGKICVPTTMNAISVDYANWREQGMDPEFGDAASSLADAYVSMGAVPSFTCAPYLCDDKPVLGELIGWSESNAVIYANSVLGARTNKHPDFLDLFIAMTGRAADVGVYKEEHRQAVIAIDVDVPLDADDSVWPLLGWLVGQLASDSIPLLRGLASHQPNDDDLKALCAAFGTTSGAPMLHIEGVTPEAQPRSWAHLPSVTISHDQIRKAWLAFNQSPAPVDLIALGSPHLSLSECAKFADHMAGRCVSDNTKAILTVGKETLLSLETSGLLSQFDTAGVRVVSDVCWCSIARPLFPSGAKTVMTNSAKYAHYGPALSGCQVLFGSLSDCADVAVSGEPLRSPPAWMESVSNPGQ